jgi:hypothetical protein
LQVATATVLAAVTLVVEVAVITVVERFAEADNIGTNHTYAYIGS